MAKKTVLCILMVMVCIPAVTFAQNERPCRTDALLRGIPFDVTGTVTSFERCSGLVLSTSSGEVTIYGLGPERYWERMDVDFPSVGETIGVKGRILQLNETQRYVAFSVTIDGDEILLRDSETGCPLWRRYVRPGRLP